MKADEIKTYWLKLKDRWAHLAPREKQAVMLGGSMLVLFIVYAGIWSPFLNHIATLRSQVQSQQKTLIWMQSADEELHQTEGQTTTHKAKTTSPVVLLSFLQKAIDQKGLAQFLTQLKQASNQTVELHFQKIEFDKIIPLLIAVLQSQPVTIQQMSATADTAPGTVNADIILKL